MHLSRALSFIIPAAVALSVAACSSPPPPTTTTTTRSTTVYTPPPQPLPMAPDMVSPQPPPPPRAELIPPPPGPGYAWQPGHWRFTGVPGHDWDWVEGGYVQRPPGETEWQLGQWQAAPNGWVWVEGHWR